MTSETLSTPTEPVKPALSTPIPPIDINARITAILTSSTTSTQSTPDAARLQKENDELRELLRTLQNNHASTNSQLAAVASTSSQAITQLNREIGRLQADRAALRASLQPPEYEGSDKTISRFASLNRAIEEWASSASEEIVAAVVNSSDPTLEPTTLDIVDLPAFKAVTLQQTDVCDQMYKGTDGKARQLELVVDFALRSIFCYHLLESIFDRFHPILGWARDPSMRALKRSNLDRPLREMYGNVRLAEPQAISGRWRTASFKAIAASPESSAISPNLIPNATQLVLHDVRRLMEAIHGRALTGQILHEPTVVEAAEVVKLAYEWNTDVKGKDVLLEYHPFGARNGGTFRGERMESMGVEMGKLTLGEGSSSPDLKVLCGVSLGLETSQAVGSGKPPKYVLHAKAKVATRHFFDEL
ncbi:hypothetical protein DL93DRAFT_2086570 [Clavulina sp. PMI_390]|nr:hypothetical protein DL93DRAFT_2086570 [Clavulina sp. PMI_390]